MKAWNDLADFCGASQFQGPMDKSYCGIPQEVRTVYISQFLKMDFKKKLGVGGEKEQSQRKTFCLSD